MAMERSDFERIFCGQHAGTGVTVVCAKYRDDRRQKFSLSECWWWHSEVHSDVDSEVDSDVWCGFRRGCRRDREAVGRTFCTGFIS
jgi:hypothetical protein